MKNKITITPIGGVAQIGSNMTFFESGEESFVIDCGIMFPYDDTFELNYLIPDFKELSPPDFLLISHGHEDHIGAISHFVQNFPKVPIYASPFAEILIRKKLHERGLAAKIISIGEESVLNIGNWSIQPFHVNHSIPETYGFVLKSEDSIIFFSSDFKIDARAKREKPFDLKRLETEAAPFSQRILFADSTNILSRAEKAGSETELELNFLQVLKQHQGRVFITLFSSNIHRLSTILEATEKAGRKACAYGGSVHKYLEAAKQTGHVPENIKLIDVDDISNFSDPKLVVICTGSQGEYRSALKRISRGEDRYFRLCRSDLVLFSSKSIPGNEKNISMLQNDLVDAGARVVTSSLLNIHVTGHACREDLAELLDSFKPTHYVPIHGESIFLEEQKNIFQSEDRIVLQLRNFDSVVIQSNGVSLMPGQEKKRPILIHGNDLEISYEKVGERRKLASLGSVFVSFHKEKYIFTTMGLPELADLAVDHYLKEVRKPGKNKKNKKDIFEEIRIGLRRTLQSKLGYRPLVIIHSPEK